MPGFFDQHRERLQKLIAELEALERKAQMREPAAAFVENIDKKDLRSQYFGVPDRQLRMALIAKYREVIEEHRKRYPASIADTKTHIAEARSKATASPWGVPAVVAGICVFVAYYLWGIAGALLAAMASILFGRWYVSKRRLHFAEELRLAEDELQTEEQGWQEELRDPANAPAFSKSEEQTGVADPPP